MAFISLKNTYIVMDPILIAVALLPVVVLAIYIYRQDKFQKEPLHMLVKAFLFGILSIFPAILLEQMLSLFAPVGGVAKGVYTGYVVAGFSEELSKLLLLYLAVWRSRYFDEYFDGIVYAAFVSLGFACFENFNYVFGQDTFASALSTGTMRAILSVPGHFLFGVTMGYYVALLKFEKTHRFANRAKALLVPMMLHGTFDALLMIPEGLGDISPLFPALLFVIFIFFDVRLWKIARRRLIRLQELSAHQNYYSYTEQPYGDIPHYHNDSAPLGGGKSLDDLDWN